MTPVDNRQGDHSRHLRVLVVDDDPDTVKTLLALVRNEGYEARGHASGEAALRALEEFMPDVVISDIAMPDVNGWELAREVRKRMGKETTLIALTGRFTQESAKVLAQICGFNHYLLKSSDPKVLLELIAKSKDQTSKPV